MREAGTNVNLFSGQSVRVGVVDMGYVGLPLALLFAKRGLFTTGFDVDAEKVRKLEAGETYIKHILAGGD